MFGSIEAGGTKFVCAISDSDLNVIKKITIKTETPDETLPKVFDFFSNYSISSLGLGSFGPIDINIESSDYGCITSTPKISWKNFNILKDIKKNITKNVSINTDVNIAAYAESKLGAAKNAKNCIYITVGTGIGGGIIINNKIIDSSHHPELGHIFINQNKNDTFNGICPYHTNCLEGLCSGPAIESRWGIKPINVPDDHIAWDLQAYYLAQAIVNYSLTLTPDIIILGGGVMHKTILLNKIKSQVLLLLNYYLPLGNIDEYIVLPQLGSDAGIIGGLLIAKELYNSKQF